jgi:hypothetical protein
MGLYKGQNIIAGSYMLPRADDIRQVNVSRKKRHKKKRRGSKIGVGRKRGKQRSREYERYLSKKHKFTPFMTRGLMTFEEKEYIAQVKRSRQLMHEEVQIIYLSIFLSPYPKTFGYSLRGYSHRERWARTR